ncbi:CRISPR-associated exonuclease Cas4/endonuclease Cas1 fusion [Methylacidimicrobium cyclopophantes]|uniref:CRISPR-associated exonuclease Cas4 n=1 Tax=Methylacidimicrobium cyclopophantes TaxID=1041766 RepID=A0A5E6MFU6_9BACT|nr:CRISPR-associated protein Cas4 [Methylacidimicrobium cyclopophantes]VVM07123.1 CRISPR-associated exonuclease Cas4/endonuclease Cas1 fusion [Methylacidimicrobium cyclopophantes]
MENDREDCKESPPAVEFDGSPGFPRASEGSWGAEDANPSKAVRKLFLSARMLNEFVYCPRLFHYELLEGLFRENADTVRGAALHARVDAGSGAMPPPAREAAESNQGTLEQAAEAPMGVIHSRSVLLGSERLGVQAKIDLLEGESDPSGGAVTVSPVDYKAGAPREGRAGNELWDPDRIQLGIQCLLLRENGYRCEEGLIYYHATRQRVRLQVTPELESWILATIEEARKCAEGPLPPPLIDSPKCIRCSLAPVCLPDETRYPDFDTFSLTL